MTTTNLRFEELAASQSNKEAVVNDTFEAIDGVLSESLNVDVTGADPADVSASVEQFTRNQRFRLNPTGTVPVHASGRFFHLNIPANKRSFVVTNGTAVEARLKISGASSSANDPTVPAGESRSFYSDGTTIVSTGGGGGTGGGQQPGQPATVPNADTDTRGIVELATPAETTTGTDGTRATTPAGVRAATDARIAELVEAWALQSATDNTQATEIVRLLGTLTGSNRLPASSIRDLLTVTASSVASQTALNAITTTNRVAFAIVTTAFTPWNAGDILVYDHGDSAWEKVGSTGSGGTAITNLSFTRTSTTVTVVSSAGTDAVLPAATTTNAGVLSAADKGQIDKIKDASESERGLVELATTTEASTGTDTERAVTPAGLAARTPDAADDTKGLVELATSGETTTGTDDTRATTPAGVRAAADARIAALVESWALGSATDATQAAEIVRLLGTLTGSNRLPSTSVRDLITVTATAVADQTALDAITTADRIAFAIVTTAFGSWQADDILVYDHGDTAWERVGSTAVGGGTAIATNLSFTRDGTSLTVVSSSGTNAVLPGATTTAAGLLIGTDKAKVDRIKDASESDKGFVELATTTEATTGTDTERAVTPAGLAARTPDASSSVKGLVELATTDEASTGTDTERAVTPAGLAARTPDATDSVKGLVELADQTEADTGTDTSKAMTAALVKRLVDAGIAGDHAHRSGPAVTITANRTGPAMATGADRVITAEEVDGTGAFFFGVTGTGTSIWTADSPYIVSWPSDRVMDLTYLQVQGIEIHVRIVAANRLARGGRSYNRDGHVIRLGPQASGGGYYWRTIGFAQNALRMQQTPLVDDLDNLLGSASETAQGLIELATTGEASTGTDTERAVTPAGLAARTPDASESVKGLVELATTTEASTGTDTERAVTPAGLAARTPDASESVKGLVELATTTEATTGADTERAVTPAGLAARTPDASITTKGLVELATNDETTTGTAGDRATTPAGVRAATDARIAALVESWTLDSATDATQAAEIVRLLGTLTGSNRLPSTSVRDLVTVTATAVASQAALNAITTDDRVAFAIVTTAFGSWVADDILVYDHGDSAWERVGSTAVGTGVAVATNLALGTRTATTLVVTSSSGTNATLPAATTTEAGLQSASDKTKLNGIAAGAQVNVATNLSSTQTATTVTVVSSAGTDAVLPAATTTNAGVLSAADKGEIDKIRNASVTARGLVELATTSEATTGTDTERAVTPAGLAARTPDAAADAKGLVELATNAEIITGTDGARAVTPAGLEHKLPYRVVSITKTAYTALTTKDADTLYFTTDST